MGHKQTPGYHKTRVLNKVRLFDRFQSKESELDRFEKLGSCAALLVTTPTKPTFRLKPKPILFLSIFEFSVMVEFPIMGIWLD